MLTNRVFEIIFTYYFFLVVLQFLFFSENKSVQGNNKLSLIISLHCSTQVRDIFIFFMVQPVIRKIIKM